MRIDLDDRAHHAGAGYGCGGDGLGDGGSGHGNGRGCDGYETETGDDFHAGDGKGNGDSFWIIRIYYAD